MKTPLFDLKKKYHYIVDTSYIVFCTASSAFKDYVFQNDVPKSLCGPDYDPTVDPDFTILLHDKFISKIIENARSINPFMFKKSNFIFTLDCPRKEIWRRDFYPEYKLQRDMIKRDKDLFNLGKVFQYVYDKIIPDFCKETGSIAISSRCAESDDIIAVLAKKLYKDDEDNFIIILSSDRDMVQLYNDRTIIIANRNEKREPKKELEAMTGHSTISESINANDFLLFKILIGDGSDNIPSVKPRLGPKSALKYVLDKSRKELKKLLKENVDILKGFKRNKQMISMNEIPDYMVKSITENIEEAFRNRDSSKEEKIQDAGIDDILSDII